MAKITKVTDFTYLQCKIGGGKRKRKIIAKKI